MAPCKLLSRFSVVAFAACHRDRWLQARLLLGNYCDTDTRVQPNYGHMSCRIEGFSMLCMFVQNNANGNLAFQVLAGVGN